MITTIRTMLYFQAEVFRGSQQQAVPLLGEHFLYRPAAQQCPHTLLARLRGEAPRPHPRPLSLLAAGGQKLPVNSQQWRDAGPRLPDASAQSPETHPQLGRLEDLRPRLSGQLRGPGKTPPSLSLLLTCKLSFPLLCYFPDFVLMIFQSDDHSPNGSCLSSAQTIHCHPPAKTVSIVEHYTQVQPDTSMASSYPSNVQLNLYCIFISQINPLLSFPLLKFLLTLI